MRPEDKYKNYPQRYSPYLDKMKENLIKRCPDCKESVFSLRDHTCFKKKLGTKTLFGRELDEIDSLGRLIADASTSPDDGHYNLPSLEREYEVRMDALFDKMVDLYSRQIIGDSDSIKLPKITSLIESYLSFKPNETWSLSKPMLSMAKS